MGCLSVGSEHVFWEETRLLWLAPLPCYAWVPLPTEATHPRVFAPSLVHGEVLCCTILQVEHFPAILVPRIGALGAA